MPMVVAPVVVAKTGSGCPPHATVNAGRSPDVSSTAYVAVRNESLPDRRTARFKALRTLDRSVAMPSAAADRMAGKSGERCCGSAGAAHVADHQRPLVVELEREHVVEVTAGLGCFAGRPVADGDLDAGDVRQRRRQQAALQRLGDHPLLFVEPMVVEARGDAAGDCLGRARRRPRCSAAMSLT